MSPSGRRPAQNGDFPTLLDPTPPAPRAGRLGDVAELLAGLREGYGHIVDATNKNTIAAHRNAQATAELGASIDALREETRRSFDAIGSRLARATGRLDAPKKAPPAAGPEITGVHEADLIQEAARQWREQCSGADHARKRARVKMYLMLLGWIVTVVGSALERWL